MEHRIPRNQAILCTQIDHLGIGCGNRKISKSWPRWERQNTTPFHEFSSMFLVVSQDEEGHFATAMSSVVKLSDPNLAVHPVLETLCDILWKLRWTLNIGHLKGHFMVFICERLVQNDIEFEILQSYYSSWGLQGCISGIRDCIPDVWTVWSWGISWSWIHFLGWFLWLVFRFKNGMPICALDEHRTNIFKRFQ